jgi:hypothetical protein
MASYALLNAFSGFTFDLANQTIGFNPIRMENGRFRCFWSLDSGWGEVEITPESVELRVLSGRLDLSSVHTPTPAGQSVQTANVGGQNVDYGLADGAVQFVQPVSIEAGQTLRLRYG